MSSKRRSSLCHKAPEMIAGTTVALHRAAIAETTDHHAAVAVDKVVADSRVAGRAAAIATTEELGTIAAATLAVSSLALIRPRRLPVARADLVPVAPPTPASAMTSAQPRMPSQQRTIAPASVRATRLPADANTSPASSHHLLTR